MLMNSDRQLAHPGAVGRCEDCHGALTPKCGSLVIWHWAHEPGSDCARGAGETDWHVAWKMWAFRHGAEVEVKMGRHRADIVWPDGRVIELQTDSLDESAVRSREAMYGPSMTWMYRWTQDKWDRLWQAGGNGRFVMRRGSKRLAFHEAPIHLHHQDRVFELRQQVELVPEYDAERNEWRDSVVITIAEQSPGVYSRPAPFAVTDSREYLRGLMVGA